MRNLLKKELIRFIFGSLIILIIFLLSKSEVLSFILLLFLTIYIIKNPIFLLVERSFWYQNILTVYLKFCKRIPFELDICNLGSTSGRYGFDYRNCGLKGENWALGPQTLSYDFKILKNYFSYLKDGATVIIPLCSFSSCIKDFEDEKVNYKYYPFLHQILILNYSEITKEKVMRFANSPFQLFILKVLTRLVKYLPSVYNSKMNFKELEKNANLFLNSWKDQFSISDLDSKISQQNQENILYNSNLLAKMISFCLDRNLKPVIVLPPVTKALNSKFSETFRENYIYSFIRQANTKQIHFLNYFDDERFVDCNLYFNSYYLNKKGRKLFTKTILKDLNLV